MGHVSGGVVSGRADSKGMEWEDWDSHSLDSDHNLGVVLLASFFPRACLILEF